MNSSDRSWIELFEYFNRIIPNKDYAIIFGMGTEDQRIRDELSKLADSLPGMDAKITCPEYVAPKYEQFTEEQWALACRGGQKDLLRVVMHLNDHHKWSREQIADWIEQEHSAGNINVAFEEKLFANREETK